MSKDKVGGIKNADLGKVDVKNRTYINIVRNYFDFLVLII